MDDTTTKYESPRNPILRQGLKRVLIPALLVFGILLAVAVPILLAANNISPLWFVGILLAMVGICIARDSLRDLILFLVSLSLAVLTGVVCRYVVLEGAVSCGMLGGSFQGKAGGILGYFLIVILPGFIVFFITWAIGIVIAGRAKARQSAK